MEKKIVQFIKLEGCATQTLTLTRRRPIENHSSVTVHEWGNRHDRVVFNRSFSRVRVCVVQAPYHVTT